MGDLCNYRFYHLHHLVKLASVSHDIFFNPLFTMKKKKKNRAGSLLAQKFGRILTALKIFAAYLSLVAKFLNFVVKFFLACLVSMES